MKLPAWICLVLCVVALNAKANSCGWPEDEMTNSINALATFSTATIRKSTNKSTRSLISGQPETGWATWYNRKSSGKTMANGKPLDERAMTCALPWKPDGKKYRTENLLNGQSIIVKHTDYGPAQWTGNLIDLTPAAMIALAGNKGITDGRVRVRVKRVK